MNVSDENAVFYVCAAFVLVAAIAGYVILILCDKIDPPDWMGKRKP